MSIKTGQSSAGGRKRQSIVGGVLFLLGLALAVIFSVVVSWPDLESFAFNRPPVTMAPLPSLHCPLIITPKDNDAVDLPITNTHVRATTLRIRSRIATGNMSLFREEIQQIALEPGEKKMLSWPISTEDAVYDRIVMVRVNQFRRTPFPARARSCGVMVLDVPWLTGNQLVLLLVLATVLGLAGGIAVWLRSERPLTLKRREAVRRGGIMLGLVLFSIVLGLLQMSSFALVLLLLSAAFLVSLVERLA